MSREFTNLEKIMKRNPEALFARAGTVANVRKKYLKYSIVLHPDKNPGATKRATVLFRTMTRQRNKRVYEIQNPGKQFKNNTKAKTTTNTNTNNNNRTRNKNYDPRNKNYNNTTEAFDGGYFYRKVNEKIPASAAVSKNRSQAEKWTQRTNPIQMQHRVIDKMPARYRPCGPGKRRNEKSERCVLGKTRGARMEKAVYEREFERFGTPQAFVAMPWGREKLRRAILTYIKNNPKKGQQLERAAANLGFSVYA